MTTFLRLLTESDKAAALAHSCARVRRGEDESRCFDVPPEEFDAVPGKPFAYWVSTVVRNAFRRLSPAHSECAARIICSTNPLNDDFRYVRVWWETPKKSHDPGWVPWAKGGSFSTCYYDIDTVIHWSNKAATYFGFLGTVNRPLERPASVQHFFRPGLTWPRRTNGLSFRVMPTGCIFADKGPAAFVTNDDPEALLALVSLLNCSAFGLLVSVQLARVELAQSFEVGLIQQTPVPALSSSHCAQLAALARRAWSLKRTLDTTTETSHAFLLPAALRFRAGAFDPPAIEAELAHIQADIDAIAFDLYGFSEADRVAAASGVEAEVTEGRPAERDDEDADDENVGASPLSADALLSWAVGVAFGRFDWLLATGERAAPPKPEPFDPLPAKSPGMLPDGAEPFHAHPGVMVDNPGHPHDLVRIVERVLERVDMPVPADLRRWLQKEFFPFHLQRYSKSRRKAPIYWPLATASGSYTLWLYYPSLTSQTLYTAINDFLDGPNGKLSQVGTELAYLRGLGTARSRDDEKRFEALQTLETELVELRDQLLAIAPRYHPNHDDGVQITAAPLWPLFRHKPWQKLLKDTWAKLEKGDYDWAHLAMNYWPDRVREKCRTDKSLAIAHGLEELYVEPETKEKKPRGRKTQSV